MRDLPDALVEALLVLRLRGDPRLPFRMEYLPQTRTAYVQYNQVADAPDETIAAFAARLRAFVMRYRWPLAFIAVVSFGYQMGNDAAQRDNARDRIERAGSLI